MKSIEYAIYVIILVFFIYLIMNTGISMMREGMTSIGCVDKKCPDGCSKPTRQSGNCREDGIVKGPDGKCFIRKKCPWECHDTFDECKYDKCCEKCKPPEYFYVPTSCKNHEESNIQHLNHTISKKDIITKPTHTKGGDSHSSQFSQSSDSQTPKPNEPSSHSQSSQPSQFSLNDTSTSNKDGGPRGYYDAIHF